MLVRANRIPFCHEIADLPQGIHPLLGEGALEDMEDCDAIDHVVVTNTFPIDPKRIRASRKLITMDLSGLLAETIRRNHHGGKYKQYMYNNHY